jgi:hypothetical protein
MPSGTSAPLFRQPLHSFQLRRLCVDTLYLATTSAKQVPKQVPATKAMITGGALPSIAKLAMNAG